MLLAGVVPMRRYVSRHEVLRSGWPMMICLRLQSETSVPIIITGTELSECRKAANDEIAFCNDFMQIHKAIDQEANYFSSRSENFFDDPHFFWATTSKPPPLLGGMK